METAEFWKPGAWVLSFTLFTNCVIYQDLPNASKATTLELKLDSRSSKRLWKTLALPD